MSARVKSPSVTRSIARLVRVTPIMVFSFTITGGGNVIISS